MTNERRSRRRGRKDKGTKKGVKVENCSKFSSDNFYFLQMEKESLRVKTACLLLSGDEHRSDPRQTEAEVLLGAEDC